MEAKACSGCKVVKPLTDFTFDRRHSDGRQSRCRECHRAYQREWKARDPEHYRRLRQAEFQRRKPKARAYWQANRDRKNAGDRARRANATPEELERIRAAHRRAAARYRERNPDACAERVRQWQQRHPERATDAANRRRARKRAVAWEPIDVGLVGDRDNWTCGICHGAIDPALTFPDHMSRSIDHIVPLVFGGTHTMANVRIAHWICNVRRGAARGEPAHRRQ